MLETPVTMSGLSFTVTSLHEGYQLLQDWLLPHHHLLGVGQVKDVSCKMSIHWWNKLAGHGQPGTSRRQGQALQDHRGQEGGRHGEDQQAQDDSQAAQYACG